MTTRPLPGDRAPWWAVVLVALASFRLEYRSAPLPDGAATFHYDGFATALLVVGMISIFMIFRVLARLQLALVAWRVMGSTVRSRFWFVIPFAIVLPAFVYRRTFGLWYLESSNRSYPEWEFQWGASNLHVLVVAGLLAVVLLHTLILMLREIAATGINVEHERIEA